MTMTRRQLGAGSAAVAGAMALTGTAAAVAVQDDFAASLRSKTDVFLIEQRRWRRDFVEIYMNAVHSGQAVMRDWNEANGRPMLTPDELANIRASVEREFERQYGAQAAAIRAELRSRGWLYAAASNTFTQA